MRQKIKKLKGQLMLMLILLISVALVIGLTIIQKSLVDVSTSTKVEQSSRAFSAAEAGIEQALRLGNLSVSFENNSQAQISDSGKIPKIPSIGSRQDPFEYPPLAKEDIAQVWLSDPDDNVKLPDCTAIDPAKHQPVCYKQTSLDVYWGTSASDLPAIELTFVYYSVGQYVPYKRYFDPITSRTSATNFEPVTCGGLNQVGTTNYQCYVKVNTLPANLMLLRARLLYNTTSQPFAVWASIPCNLAGNACFIPPQARSITSTGTSGETQRRVRLFQINKIVPPYFDYAIFSAGDISK